jgi:sulfur carrier protein ThiS adenylyltransferase
MTFEQIKEILKTKIVGIAGCGGLGSNAAVALARIGMGRLIIADFDKIELSNLNRQYYFYNQVGLLKAETLKENIAKINPSVDVRAHTIKLGAEDLISLYKDCDVIVEAFDKAEMKQMLVETMLAQMPGKPVVCGVGMAGWGKNELLKVERYGNLYMVGDGVTEANEETPVMAPRVCAVANMMANVVLEILIGEMKQHENNIE